MMKKIGLCLASLMLAWSCMAIDYSLHMSDARVYRVALGSGNTPSTADVKAIGIRTGDFVENTDDHVLYIMHATNVYTKITAAGAVTIGALAALDVTGNANITGSTTSGTLRVTSTTVLSGIVSANSNLDVAVDATVDGKVYIVGVISNTALTASLPVFTDADKQLVSGTTDLATTNATVGGGVLSGVTLVLTNASNGSVAGIVTNTTTTEITLVVTNGANGAVVGIVTNVAYTSSDIFTTNVTYTAIDMVTNLTWTTATYTNANFTVTNVFTVYYDPVQETVAVNTINALEKGTVLVSITPETGDITPTFTPAYGTAVASVTDETGDITPTLTLETGTPAVSTPTITLETGTFAKP